MTKIKYKATDWRKMETIKDATATSGKWKRDREGRVVEWLHGGKRVETKLISLPGLDWLGTEA